MEAELSIAGVRDYYSRVLQSSSDLQTNACCTTEAVPPNLREAMSRIHPEILEKFYGCGSPLPLGLEGKVVLDLGCGTGRDAYLLSQLVGESGRVIGIDMTREQLEVARRHVNFHMQNYGYAKANVEFFEAYIEDLASVGIEDASVDVVVSNCVINLAPDKKRVFQEIFRVLKPGGELYFSDVFASRRLPKDCVFDPILRGECLGGALYKEDFRRLLSELGCRDFRVMSKSPISIQNPAIEVKLGQARFESITVRAFKLDLEDRCEDYGQAVKYLGTIKDAAAAFRLDDHHLFEKGRWFPVCSNTATMLKQTRFAPHFDLAGDLSQHYGLFDCAPATSPATLGSAAPGACC